MDPWSHAIYTGSHAENKPAENLENKLIQLIITQEKYLILYFPLIIYVQGCTSQMYMAEYTSTTCTFWNVKVKGGI